MPKTIREANRRSEPPLEMRFQRLLASNAAGFTDFLQRLREAVRPNWYRADHMIECDMIGVLLMIRLIYLLRIDGAIEVTACGS